MTNSNPVLDDDVLVLGVAKSAEPLAERGDVKISRRALRQHSDPMNFRPLLRLRNEPMKRPTARTTSPIRRIVISVGMAGGNLAERPDGHQSAPRERFARVLPHEPMTG